MLRHSAEEARAEEAARAWRKAKEAPLQLATGEWPTYSPGDKPAGTVEARPLTAVERRYQQDENAILALELVADFAKAGPFIDPRTVCLTCGATMPVPIIADCADLGRTAQIMGTDKRGGEVYAIGPLVLAGAPNHPDGCLWRRAVELTASVEAERAREEK